MGSVFLGTDDELMLVEVILQKEKHYYVLLLPSALDLFRVPARSFLGSDSPFSSQLGSLTMVLSLLYLISL
jgi:hypothetical protein